MDGFSLIISYCLRMVQLCYTVYSLQPINEESQSYMKLVGVVGAMLFSLIVSSIIRHPLVLASACLHNITLLTFHHLLLCLQDSVSP